MGCFGRYLSLWVVLSAGLGVIVGHYAPSVPEALDKATISHISVPVAVLIWLMVFPMILKIDLRALRNVRANKVPVAVTSGVNYLIQPFTMYALARLFFEVVFRSTIDDRELEDEYVGGAVILGGSPCTAMVFVWSCLVNGDAAYTLVQVAFNDLLIFVFYIPTMMLLLQATSIPLPWDTAFVAVALFMLVPGLLALAVRWYGLRYHSEAWIQRITEKSKPVTIVALLATLFLIFTFQGDKFVDNPVHVLLIAVPLLLQSVIIFAIAYGLMAWLRVPHRQAAPGALIATSNFFELAVAVAMSLFGAESGATLATVVGVLEEVPVMLALVWFCNRTRAWFPDPALLPAYIQLRRDERALIPGDRELELERLADAVVQVVRAHGRAMLLFVCQHNARRSQLCDVWFRTALTIKGHDTADNLLCSRVSSLSGGSEISQIDPRTIRCLKSAGLSVRRRAASTYVCGPMLPNGRAAPEGVATLHAKMVGDAVAGTDKSALVVVPVCSPEQSACPLVPAAQHVPLPYNDPSRANNTPGEAAAYDDACSTIAREMLALVDLLAERLRRTVPAGLVLCDSV